MQTQTDSPQPVRIEPAAVYREGQLRLLLGLSESDLRKARHSKHLRFTSQGRTRLYRGQWVLDWIDSASLNGPEQPRAEAACEEQHDDR